MNRIPLRAGPAAAGSGPGRLPGAVHRLRPLLLLELALCGFGAGDAWAQAGASLDLPVQVDVVNGLSVFIEAPLDFGAVVENAGVQAIARTSGRASRFRLYGQQNRTVSVTLSPPANLGNGTDLIPYTWQAAYNETINDPADPATVVLTGTTTTIVLGDRSPPGRDGQAFVWVYGAIDVGDVSPGAYTGTFTLSAAY